MSRKSFFNSTPAAVSALALAMGVCANAASVRGLSVCANGAGDIGMSLSCPGGTETLMKVAGPQGTPSINNYGGFGGISDEHQTIFPPGALQGNSGYMFFVSTRAQNAPSTGLVVLSAPQPPVGSNGQWTLSPVEGYGSVNGFTSYGQLFLSPVPHDYCPWVHSASQQDPTFDLNYAAPGSVVLDSTNPGSLLMIYEGSNTCVGYTTGPGTTPQQGGVYITTGVATSVDYGRSWPAYRVDFPYWWGLPFQINWGDGPWAPLGAFGESVCMGDSCDTTPPANYGRYPVLSATLPLSDIMKWGTRMQSTVADSEPSAFIDDAVQAQYIYVVHDETPDPYRLLLPGAKPRPFDLGIARAKLNGGTAPLSFKKWDGHAYESPGMGGGEQQLLPDGDFGSCGDPIHQHRHAGSISYLDETKEYLLLFVCDSDGEPLPGSTYTKGALKGAAWFWSKSNNLSNPVWSPPLPVGGSWSLLGADGSYDGWYPSVMSLNKNSGHLSTAPLNTSYVFSMSGAQGSTPTRTYMSRTLTITAQ